MWKRRGLLMSTSCSVLLHPKSATKKHNKEKIMGLEMFNTLDG